MINRILPLATVVASLLATPVFAQTTTPDNAPIPKNGTLVQQPDGMSVSKQIKTGNLPGVDFSAPPADAEAAGPGGLQNEIGAVGMSVPSQSSTNPVPVEPATGDGVGIPLGAPPAN